MSLDSKHIYNLFLLNLVLQLFDGLATYQGIKLGWEEANPLLVLGFDALGVGPALLLFKAKACGLLFLLHRLAPAPMLILVLSVLAGAYALLSFFPWLILLSGLLN
ncbi:MAG: hypothetical protein HY695_26870 [Deltaproteobacteria bacterium]|nr:hypothetical protein [Deltaproteobacteria bacterium]